MSKTKEFKTEVYISTRDDEFHDDFKHHDVECVTYHDGCIKHGVDLEERLYQLFGDGALITVTATISENDDEWQGLH